MTPAIIRDPRLVPPDVLRSSGAIIPIEQGRADLLTFEPSPEVVFRLQWPHRRQRFVTFYALWSDVEEGRRCRRCRSGCTFQDDTPGWGTCRVTRLATRDIDSETADHPWKRHYSGDDSGEVIIGD